MNKYMKCFCYGWMANVGIHMAHQDWMGLERYIDYLRVAWMDMSPAWGVGIAMLAVWLFIKEKDKGE